MKKTITVNIASVAFSIDEDAYQMLQAYLEDISFRLKSQNEDFETIINDIEVRIEEILRENGVNDNQVITIANIKRVISVIGNPSVFGEGGKRFENSEACRKNEYGCLKKRMMRDPDNKILGGVCSGIASYVNQDTILVRIIFFIFLFLAGLTFWIYIILWIVVPVATTQEEKDMLKHSRRI